MRVLIKIVTHIGPKTRISSRLDYDQNDYPNDEWKGPAKKEPLFSGKTEQFNGNKSENDLKRIQEKLLLAPNTTQAFPKKRSCHFILHMPHHYGRRQKEKEKTNYEREGKTRGKEEFPSATSRNAK